jgi:nucleoid-associated protein YgaU
MPDVSPKKSKTAPAYASMLRNIMFLSRVTDARNKLFNEKLKAHIASTKSRHPDLSSAQLEKAKEGFTRDFYKHEYLALNEYEVIKEKHDALISKRDSGGLNKKEEKTLLGHEYHLSLKPEGYAAQTMMRKDVIASLKKEYPEIEKGLKTDIKTIASGMEGVDKRYAHMPAAVELFKKEFPGLEGELLKASQKGGTEDKRMLGKAALAMLKAGSAYANPSSILVSKAVGRILATDACKSLTANIAKGVRHAGQKTGLTGWVKKQLAKAPETSLKRVALGVTVVGVTGLTALGLMEPEQAMEIAAHVKDNVVDYVAEITADVQDNKQAIAGAGSDSVSANGKAGVTMLDGSLSNPPPGGDIPAPPAGSDVPTVDDTSKMLEGMLGGDADDTPSQEQEQKETLEQDPEQEPPAPTIEEVEAVREQLEKVLPKAELTGEFTVVSGDTLSEIVEQQFIDAGLPYDYQLIEDRVDMIAEANRLENPDEIRPGQVFKFAPLPSPEDIVPRGELLDKVASDIAIQQNGCEPAAKEGLKMGVEQAAPEQQNSQAQQPPEKREPYQNRTMHA